MDTNREKEKAGRGRLLRRLAKAASFALTVGALITFAAGVTFALVSSAAPARNRAVPAGTVTLTNNVSGGCSVSNVLPGAAPSPCALQATYTGSIHAYLAIDVLIETQAGNGSANLYVPSDPSHDLQIGITSTSPSVTYTVPTAATSCPGMAPSGSTCYELDKELVSATPFTSSSAAVTFTTTLSLPMAATTGYRGGAAQIYLTVHASQSSNNSIGSCTAGTVCSTLQWS